MKAAVMIFSLLLGCSGSQKSEEKQVHHKKDGMQHRFDDAEHWSKVFDAPERDAWQKPTHVVELLEIEPGFTVVDIGAGTGYFMSYLSAAVGPEGSVLAVDIEPTLIAHMKQRAEGTGLTNVTAQLAEPNDPGLDPASADRILIVDTWHHIGDRRSYSMKLAEALKPGGSVYIVDFTLETERGPGKKHRVEPEVVMGELASAGLDIAELTEELPDQYVVKGTLSSPSSP